MGNECVILDCQRQDYGILPKCIKVLPYQMNRAKRDLTKTDHPKGVAMIRLYIVTLC